MVTANAAIAQPLSGSAPAIRTYQPTPGTAVFAGYGNTLATAGDDPRTPSRLRRTVDGFFLKVSYLFRL